MFFLDNRAPSGYFMRRGAPDSSPCFLPLPNVVAKPDVPGWSMDGDCTNDDLSGVWPAP